MNRFLAKCLLVGAAAILSCGCGGDDAENASAGPGVDPAPIMEAPVDTIPVSFEGQKLCLACGEAFAKDAEHTCKEDAEKCGDCNLVKGSALCCKHVKVYAADAKALCGSCGHVAGTEDCCKEGAEKCADCKLHKGSPACCKLSHDHKHDHKSE